MHSSVTFSNHPTADDWERMKPEVTDIIKHAVTGTSCLYFLQDTNTNSRRFRCSLGDTSETELCIVVF